MFESIAQQIWVGANPLELALAYGSMAAGGVLGATLLWPAARSVLMPGHEESRLADYLPFERVLADGAMMRLKNGGLAVAIRVPGVSMAAATRGERTSYFLRRVELVNELAGTGISARVITRRSRAPLPRDFPCAHPVRAEILRRFHARFDFAARVRHVVVLTAPSQTEEARDKLDRAASRAIKLLQPFGARLFDHGESQDKSDLLAFWAELANPIVPVAIGRSPANLAKRLSGGAVTADLDTGLLTFEAGAGRQSYAYVVVVPGWGDESAEELVPQLLALDADLTILQRWRGMAGEEAELLLQKAGDWARATNPWSTGIVDQFQSARELVVPGSENFQALNTYEFYVVAHGESPEEAKRWAGEVEARLLDVAGARGAVETDLVQQHYFGQFPGYETTIRGSFLFAQNVAEFVTFPATPTGFSRSPWGDGPLLILPTETGTPYLFNLHEAEHDEAAGHFVVIGGTGGGKTTGVTLAATGALRFPKCKVFAFDADRGMLVWTMFAGGRYIGLQSDLPGTVAATLQPFQLPWSDANRAHLRVFLRMLVGLETPEADQLIGKALDIAERVPFDQRRLDIIIDAAFPRDSEARHRLERWVDPAQYGNVFCGRSDNMPIAGADLVTFDMTSLLKDPTLAPPIVLDAMHRIDAAVAAAQTGAMIIVDEAPFLLRNAAFRDRLLERLRRDRKRRIAVGLLVQGAGDLDQISSDLGTDVRKLTATWIFLPNPKADPEEYKPWDLTDREMLFIRRQLRSTAHMRYPALIKKKQLGESVFVDLDNGSLGDMAAIFKSGEVYWRRALDHLQLAPSPEAALELYLSEYGR